MKKILTIAVIIAILMLWGQNSRAGTLTWDLQSMYGSISQTTIASAIADAKNHFSTNPDDIIIVEIAAGTYNIGGNGSKGIDFSAGLLSLSAKGRLIFQGAGMNLTTLVFTDTEEDMMNGNNVYNLEFRDMHMTRNIYGSTQGTVVSVAPGQVILDLAPDFPTPLQLFKDWGQGRYLKKYTNSLTDPQLIRTDNDQVAWGWRNDAAKLPEQISGNRWRIYLNSETTVLSNYHTDDYVAVKAKYHGNIYWFSVGNDLVFRNIKWTHSTRGLVRGGFNNCQLYGCRFERGPAINGQTPCMSSSEGGPQMNQPSDVVSTGMVLEDCFIDSPGDDNIAFFHVDGGRVKNCTIRNGFARGILATSGASNICVTNTVMQNAYLLDESVTPEAIYWSAADAAAGGGAFYDCEPPVTLNPIPWSETFTYANGKTSNGAPTTWTATNMSVQNNEMSYHSTTAGVFTTGPINISSGAVTVSVKVRGGSGLDTGQDYLRLFKKVDGGAEVQIAAADGPLAATTWTVTNITGSSLVLVLRSYVSSTSEYYYFDDLSVVSSGTPTYTITTTATNGTITRDLIGPNYAPGTVVALTATPNSGYTFTGWSGDITGTTNPANITVNANKSVTANFAPITYTITTTATNGTISRDLIGPNYAPGTVVALTATPNSGYTFTGWSGDITGTTNPANIIVDANKNVTASFTAITLPNVTTLTGWVSGTTNTKVAGSNRMMVVMVMGEKTTSFTATGVTYGGQAMTKVTEKSILSGGSSYSAIFILKETGVNAATSGTIAVTWSATPSFNIYSVLLGNVDQTTTIVSANNSIASATSITTSALAAANGDMVVMCGATANNNTQTFNNSFTKQFESNSSWGDGVGGNKMGTGVSETPKFTQSAAGRMTICAIVAKKSALNSALKSAFIVSGAEINKSTGNIAKVFPNPVSGTLYIDHAEGTNIRIFNIQGQLIYNKNVMGTQTNIEVAELKVSGLVLVQITSGDETSMFKVLLLE